MANKLKNILVVFLTIICAIIPFGFIIYVLLVSKIECSINNKLYEYMINTHSYFSKKILYLKSYLRP